MLYENPDNMFAADFIGSPRMNFIPATVSGAAGENAVTVAAPAVGLNGMTVATRGKLPKRGTTVSLGVRPEHFVAADQPAAAIEGRITVIERLGGFTYIHASLADGNALTVESRDGRDFRQGYVRRFGIDATRAFLFDGDGRRI